MNVVTMSLVLPCPSCQVRQPLRAAHAGGGAQESRVVVHECPRCWQRRAKALNEAREGLRQQGELGACDGILTWRGERLDDSRPHDALLGALMSELLRRDVPAHATMSLALPAPEPVESVSERR